MNMPDDLKVKEAQLEHVSAISDLVNSAYRGDTSRKGWTTETDLVDGQRTDPDSLAKALSDEKNRIFLFYRNNNLHGTVFLQNKLELAYLGMLSVKPDQQATGLGRIILEFAEEWVIKNWGSERIEMTVIHRRDELLAWYERRGYSRSGREVPFPSEHGHSSVPKVEGLKLLVLEKYLSRGAFSQSQSRLELHVEK